MGRKGRILVVDDNAIWRGEVIETLQREGYIAEAAATKEQALEKLNNALFHLAILDICLQDMSNPDNTDGLDILREMKARQLNETVKVIMLSGHDTKEHLHTTFKEYKVIDFLAKDNFDRKTLLGEVQKAFTKEMTINLALGIRWRSGYEPEDAVLNLAIDGGHVAAGTALHTLIATELEDLLCRLFYDSDNVIVHPVSPGYSATGVLTVERFHKDTGARGRVIVKFGDAYKIDQECSNFKKYVEHSLGGARSTVIHGEGKTPHLGGIIYSFVGMANARLDDFGEFYRRQTTTIEDIKGALDNLFLETCGPWYDNRGQAQPRDLSEDYRTLLNFTPAKLHSGILALGDAIAPFQNNKLVFQALSSQRAFIDPRTLAVDRPQWISTYLCTTHGDFNSHNILLDDHRNTWLIDFLRTGRGHILRDISELDSIVRFELLTEHEANLEERLALEEVLCSIDRFSRLGELEASFSTENKFLAKTFVTVIHLRKLTEKLLARRTHENMEEYFIALFYHALNTLRFNDLSITQREHALLCASLLAETLHLK